MVNRSLEPKFSRSRGPRVSVARSSVLMYFVSFIYRSMSRSKREEYYFSILTVYLSVG